ncbi:MAG: UDP-3-O-(3-hydroxymyristoyl)glucosamine N-acyltransferase [Armatimonadota bacterium]
MIFTTSELCKAVNGVLIGDDSVSVTGVSSVEDAQFGDIVLAADKRYYEKALQSSAVCILTNNSIENSNTDKCIIKTQDPARAFVKILELFKDEAIDTPVGISDSAVIYPDANIGNNVSIGSNCVVSRGAKIGDNTILSAGVFIGSCVKIGNNCLLHPNCVVYNRCIIGNNVILHAGVVIGADGFGYIPSSEGLVKYPHNGIVEIGDNVEIGANSAIDRAKTGKTIIGSGTKIDNLVHIAHNVKIGSNCIIVALSGVAGSVEIGNNVTLAAQSGVKDHIKIGDGAVLAARAGAIGDIPNGAIVSGFPARDHKLEKRAEAARLRLPDYIERLRVLEKEIEALKNEINRNK